MGPEVHSWIWNFSCPSALFVKAEKKNLGKAEASPPDVPMIIPFRTRLAAFSAEVTLDCRLLLRIRLMDSKVEFSWTYL
jgi:hypothetical protein